MLFSRGLLIHMYVSVFMITLISPVYSIEPEIHENNLTYENDNTFSISLYDSLLSAIEIDNSHEVKLFIEFGADINFRYTNGKTPLMIASSLGSINVIKILLALGADTDLTSNDSMSAIDYAYQANDRLIINTLTDEADYSSDNNNDIIIAEDMPKIN